ncbi:hypothetical protein BX666DRAFT_1898560 [Dichotomocladium elegans]|nr:hypothetical protein BX666DRAFT_1898560 [Dichotomocladium elegans]
MAPPLHFENVFWSQKQPQEPIPDFQTGLQVLHNKLNQSKIENDEIISFFKDRIATEEAYAARLNDQARVQLKLAGFARDDGAVLRGCFENLKEANGRFGEQHLHIATTLTETVLRPLQRYQEEYKRNILTSKQSVDAALKQLDGLIKETERAQATYQKKFRALMEEEQNEKPLPSTATSSPPSTPTGGTQLREQQKQQGGGEEAVVSDDKLIIGTQPMTRAELDELVGKMKDGIPIGEHRVPILGRYQNTSTGEAISVWLQQNLPQCKDSPAMADVVGQQLIHPLGILRLVGQRGNKFSPSAQSFYQWREEGVVAAAAAAAAAAANSTNSTGNATSSVSNYGFGFLERIGGHQQPSEDLLRRAQREASSAEDAYRAAVIRVNQMRMAVEQALFAHFAEMEEVEMKRLAVLKQAISSYALSVSEMLPGNKAIVDEMLLYQESLKPDQDIQYIVQQYCVSSFSPKPILFESQTYGIARHQTFGVPLEELARQAEDNVPRFVSYLLEAIEKGSDQLSNEDKKRLWCTPLPLDKVHAVCMELNVPSDQVTMDLFQNRDPMLLVAVLRLYLLELPECLMTFEFYDAAQALYSNPDQDDSLRLQPLGNLISTLPGPYFSTLRRLVDTIYQYVQKENIMDFVQVIGETLGPIILRPRTESLATLISRVPGYFAQDLIKHRDVLFNEGTFKSHAENEKRRHARPLKADTASIVTNNTSQDATVTTHKQQRRGIMSFMRGTNEDKWGMLFQRTAPGSQPGSTPSSERVSSSSFTRPATIPSGTAITQESPPLTPQIPAEEPALRQQSIEELPPAQTPPAPASPTDENIIKESTPVVQPVEKPVVQQQQQQGQAVSEKADKGKPKDDVVFDAIQENQKNESDALDPFFEDEDEDD